MMPPPEGGGQRISRSFAARTLQGAAVAVAVVTVGVDGIERQAARFTF